MHFNLFLMQSSPYGFLSTIVLYVMNHVAKDRSKIRTAPDVSTLLASFTYVKLSPHYSEGHATLHIFDTCQRALHDQDTFFVTRDIAVTPALWDARPLFCQVPSNDIPHSLLA